MAKMTEAQKRAALKYQRGLGQISIRLPKDELKRYKDAAQKAGMPFRAWVLSAIGKATETAAFPQLNDAARADARHLTDEQRAAIDKELSDYKQAGKPNK